MFRSIVVPLDLDVVGDRALPVAGSLARLGGLPIELLTISSPRMAGFVDACELDRRVKLHGLGPHSINILYDDDAGRAITRYIGGRDDALVVMGSSAKGPLRELTMGSVSEHVLAHAHRPILIVGPNVEVVDTASAPSLVVGLDAADLADAAITVIEAWQRTFGGEVTAVEDLGEDLGNAVVVATSTGWTRPGVHWHSTARQLARHSIRPVLVVPADRTARAGKVPAHRDVGP